MVIEVFSDFILFFIRGKNVIFYLVGIEVGSCFFFFIGYIVVVVVKKRVFLG